MTGVKGVRIAIGLVMCLIGASGTMAAGSDTPIFVGIFEDIEPGNLSPGMAKPHVRVAFQYRSGTWAPMAGGYPGAVTWTVVLDGKRIGSIASRQGPHPVYLGGDVGIQEITTGAASIPRVRKGAAGFSYTGNNARTRPLLLVSAPRFHDPDGWKPTALSADEKQVAIQRFRKRVPSLEQCNDPDGVQVHLVPYLDDEIVFAKAYRSKDGRVLFGESLSSERSKCDFFDDPTFFDYWFMLKDGVVQFLDTQMTPLEAADIEGTGRSQWVFQTSRGEDRDGYELFYDDFSKNVSFSWEYH